jgi:NAD(P)-dependent dehydrogenase (short-subunit alcohol dehydrogenase family)
MGEIEMKALFDLHGKVALVTGGNIGNLAPIWIETLKSVGAKVFDEYFDITKTLDIIEARQQCIDKYGVPQIIVNNATIDNPPGSKATFFGNFKDIMDVNLFGAIRVIQNYLPLMIKQGGGVIVNIGSIMGNVGADWRNYDKDFEKPVAYNLSKCAYLQLSRSIATQYGRFGMRSVTISFAAVDTGKYNEPFKSKFLKCLPLGRMISKESLQMTLLYACCCPELTGQQLLVDSGYTSW